MRKPRPLPLSERPHGSNPPLARRRRLLIPALLLAAGVASLATTIVLPPVPRLVWNASASAPIGLYAVSPHSIVQTGDMVFAWPPFAARELAARRHYLPRNVPLLKRVVAMAGDTICAQKLVVNIDGQPVALRRSFDRMGRPLPAWQGCIRLTEGEFFLLMTIRPDSFDGRYFGVSKRQDLIGKATPLWLP